MRLRLLSPEANKKRLVCADFWNMTAYLKATIYSYVDNTCREKIARTKLQKHETNSVKHKFRDL